MPPSDRSDPTGPAAPPVRGPRTARLADSRRRLLVAVWCAVSLFLLARLCARALVAQLSEPVPWSVSLRIDINTARVPELMLLDGVGRKRAEQIVLHRVRHGWFERLEDLLDVDGIGDDTLRRLRPFLCELPQ